MKIQATKSEGFEWRNGDEVICCTEMLECGTSSAGNPKADLTLRVVAGPIGDAKRNAGPFIGQDGTIHSKKLKEILTFTDAAMWKVGTALYACGHDGEVETPEPNDLNFQADLEMLLLDREVRVRVKLDPYQGRNIPKPDSMARPTPDDMRRVVDAYNTFGCARGMGWVEHEGQIDPIVPWDPSQYDGGSVAGGGGRRAAGRTVAPPPVRNVAPAAQPAAAPIEQDLPMKSELASLLATKTAEQVKEWLDTDHGFDLAEVLGAEVAGKKRKNVIVMINTKINKAVIDKQDEVEGLPQF